MVRATAFAARKLGATRAAQAAAPLPPAGAEPHSRRDEKTQRNAEWIGSARSDVNNTGAVICRGSTARKRTV